MTDKADVAERDEDEITEADRQVLREIIRDELKAVLPKIGDGEGKSSATDAGAPEPGAGDLEHADPANLSLRQITDRMMILTGKALDKVPGGNKAAAEPKAPAPQKPPVPRGLKVLGFHDLD